MELGEAELEHSLCPSENIAHLRRAQAGPSE